MSNELRIFAGQGIPPVLAISVTNMKEQLQVQFWRIWYNAVMSRLEPDTDIKQATYHLC